MILALICLCLSLDIASDERDVARAQKAQAEASLQTCYDRISTMNGELDCYETMFQLDVSSIRAKLNEIEFKLTFIVQPEIAIGDTFLQQSEEYSINNQDDFAYDEACKATVRFAGANLLLTGYASQLDGIEGEILQLNGT